MLANNETGVIQPISEAARLAHDAGALIHTDAVQALGKIPVDLKALGVDLISVAAHKLGGPQGVGALIANDVELTPRLLGGAQERVRRAGTENLAGIVGFAAACSNMRHGATTQILRDRLEAAIAKDAPDAVIFGTRAPRLPNTSLIALPDFASESQVIALDLAGVAVSSGAACSSGKVHASRVLDAMGAGAWSNCAIRVSLGWASTDDDITQFLTAWFDMRARRKARDRHAAVAA
jgi:cysteine desulfurase